MPSLLHFLSFVGGICSFIFVTLSLASGLLWLAELIEEHSKAAKTIGVRMIYSIIVLHVLLLAIDRLPLHLIAFSILCHVVYLQNFTPAWPFISLSSPRFVASCCVVIIDHFLWFFHFAEKSQEAKRYRPGTRYRAGLGAANGGGKQSNTSMTPPTFFDIAAFFAICVWLVPLFLFLSLSANDNVLPSLGPGTPSARNTDDPLNGSSPAKKAPAQGKSILKTILTPLFAMLPRLGNRRTRAESGLIAPRLRGYETPLPSPGYAPWGTPSESIYGAPSPIKAFGDALSAKQSIRIAPPPPKRSPSPFSPLGNTGSGDHLAPTTPVRESMGNGMGDLGVGSGEGMLRSTSAQGFSSGASAGNTVRRATSQSKINGEARRKED